MSDFKFYSDDFNFFLSRTDEKIVLREAIEKQLPVDRVESVVDIGAGEGSISIPLSKKISKYLAIEPNNIHAEILRKNNIEVLERAFPFEMSESFDAAISCHSISHKPEIYKPFIDSALKILKPRGTFILVDFRGRNDSWSSLMQRVNKQSVLDAEFHSNQIYSRLISRGEVCWSIVKSKLLTNDLEDMLKALSFVYSGGDRNKKRYFISKRDIVVDFLNKRHWFEDGYIFFFEHRIIKFKLR